MLGGDAFNTFLPINSVHFMYTYLSSSCRASDEMSVTLTVLLPSARGPQNMALKTGLRDIRTYLCAGSDTLVPPCVNAVSVTSQATWWKTNHIHNSELPSVYREMYFDVRRTIS